MVADTDKVPFVFPPHLRCLLTQVLQLELEFARGSAPLSWWQPGRSRFRSQHRKAGVMTDYSRN